MNRYPLSIRSRAVRGFTLVELMVVILIIGMLSGIVIYNVNSSTIDARLRIARVKVRNLGRAVEMYVHRAEMLQMADRMPRSLQDLIDGPEGFDGRWESVIADRRVPKDPWGREYEYKIVDEQRGEFVVVCFGADGQPGGGMPYDADIRYPWSDDGN